MRSSSLLFFFFVVVVFMSSSSCLLLLLAFFLLLPVRHQAFDPAVLDRVDEAVEFKLPAQSERAELISKYFNEYIVSVGLCMLA